ncbi:MAG: DUF4139 domain-containing protein [Bacteroidota bacterium]
MKKDSLRTAVEKLDRQIKISESRLAVLTEKQSVLNANKDLSNDVTNNSLETLKAALGFYEKELTVIKKEELLLNLEIATLNEKKELLEKQLATLGKEKAIPTGEIELRVETNATSVKGNFKISYLVNNAGWYPKYDVRVSDVSKPLSLQYYADVYQNTNVDWTNVQLRFSNGNPNQSGVAPELKTWYLNYARNTVFYRNQQQISNRVRIVSGKVVSNVDGEPLPGVSVLVKGTTVGTTTDFEGNYSLTLPNNISNLVFTYVGFTTQEIPITSSSISVNLEEDASQLEEVVVVAYGLEGRAAGVSNRNSNYQRKKKSIPIKTTTVENQTTVEFEVEKPYTLQSGGERLTVALKQHDIEAIYEYYAVPKLDKDAFLIAKIINWDQYNLLEGEANLYFEDAYVGRSVLDAKILSDTLTISLGRDKSIVLGREKLADYTKFRTIGANKIESRAFDIIAKNKKSQPIQLTIYDQMPVSSISDISIQVNETSAGLYNEKSGEVTWKLQLAPNEQKELKIAYEVKYPKREKVILE